ncbi:arylsulfatase I [Elysia marginata]|uniref:Arylsulfatase I n=1 Tax=Elysia marginata TaxID=1093978 RepID=A0AAV4IZ72_9GAST|nr:arylsulfatase I [Elysia marginata]
MVETKPSLWHILAISLVCINVAGGQKPPNIVFIVADDYGFHDIGYHGSEFQTPNLDKLANGGVKLENYYVQPICSPTRSQLMTGRYQIHTGLQHNIIWPSQPYGLPLQYPTVANLLKEKGYSTHAVGKWHLGLYKKEYTPLHRGFDTFYGYWEGGEDYYTYYNCDTFHNRTVDENETGNRRQKNKRKWCGYDLRDMETPVTNMNGTYSTHLYTGKAIDVVKNATKSKKPFFLYLAYQAVHTPMEVPQHYMEPYSHIKNKFRRIYAGMVSAMDEGVGNVTKALNDNGLWDDTIIIFSTGMVSAMDEGVGNVTKALKDNGLWDDTIIIFSTGDGSWYPVPSSAEGPSPPKSSSSSTDTKNVWLFNVARDPYEAIDLSATMSSTLHMMLERLRAYNATAVPPVYPPSDPNCDPKLHGGFWGPWE